MPGSQHHPGKSQEKSMVLFRKRWLALIHQVNIGATIGLNSSFLEGWDESTDVANAKHVIFFSNSIKKQFWRLKIEAIMLCSNFCFIFVICLWVNSVFHQNRAQTHRRADFWLWRRGASHVSSHETWTIPNRSKDWFIANYLNHDAFSNTRFVAPSRENAAKNNCAIEHWTTSGLNSCFLEWLDESQDIASPRYVIFLPKVHKCNAEGRRVEIKPTMFLIQFFFQICNFSFAKWRFSSDRGPRPNTIVFPLRLLGWTLPVIILLAINHSSTSHSPLGIPLLYELLSKQKDLCSPSCFTAVRWTVSSDNS